ncbi:hypothetical protein J3L18_31210 [Mucilaginibacter gossypii]|uniref:hypothetical protein n=1 Tax=Mucilaginibacter gossypii TaxID=551996 RepID=UPI00287F72E0|nr:hypothetical protein [Mucilaginibacter gossypii]WMH62836.1 hypothetical protein J3L18_31210 [Mucilaginibacter gossypii]
MNKLLKFLLLMLLASTLQAQQKPPYDRTTTNQVMADRATWSRYFMGTPKGDFPVFPSYVPDSIKCGAIFYRTADTSQYVYNCISGKWDKQQKATVSNKRVDSVAKTILPFGKSGETIKLTGDNLNTYKTQPEVTFGNYVTTATELDSAKTTYVSNATIYSTFKHIVHGGRSGDITNQSLNDTLLVNPQQSNSWLYDTPGNFFYNTNNSGSLLGLISPKAVPSYTFKATLSANDADNDRIGLIAGYTETSKQVINKAYGMSSGDFNWPIDVTSPTIPEQYTLTVIRNRDDITQSFVIWYNYRKTNQKIIANGSSMPGLYNTTAGWSGVTVDLQLIMRNDTLYASTSNFSDAPGGKGSLAYTLVVPLASDTVLNKFRGSTRYGFASQSQAAAKFTNVSFAGAGVNEIYDLANKTVWVANSSGVYTIAPGRSPYKEITPQSLVFNSRTKKQIYINSDSTFTVQGGVNLDSVYNSNTFASKDYVDAVSAGKADTGNVVKPYNLYTAPVGTISPSTITYDGAYDKVPLVGNVEDNPNLVLHNFNREEHFKDVSKFKVTNISATSATVTSYKGGITVVKNGTGVAYISLSNFIKAGAGCLEVTIDTAYVRGTGTRAEIRYGMIKDGSTSDNFIGSTLGGNIVGTDNKNYAIINGVSNTSTNSTTPAFFNGSSYTYYFTFNNDYINAYRKDAYGNYVYAGQMNVGSYINSNDTTTFKNWRFAIGINSDYTTSTTIHIKSIKAGYWKGLGASDYNLVTTLNGSPYISNGKAFFSSTAHGFGATTGLAYNNSWVRVISLDLSTRHIDNSGIIFRKNGAKICGDYSPQIIYNDSTNTFSYFVGNYADSTVIAGSLNNLKTMYRHGIKQNILQGVSLIDSMQVYDPYPGAGTLDASFVRKNGYWYGILSKINSSTVSEQVNIVRTKDFVTTTTLFTEDTLVRREGNKVVLFGGKSYFMSTGLNTNAIYYYNIDGSGGRLGTFAPPINNGASPPMHPAILGISNNNQTRYFIVANDNTKYLTTGGTYTYSPNLYVYQIAQKLSGMDYPMRPYQVQTIVPQATSDQSNAVQSLADVVSRGNILSHDGINFNGVINRGSLFLTQAGNNVQAIQSLSGSSSLRSDIQIGRTATELIIGVAASANQYITGTAAGDVAFYRQSGSGSFYFNLNNNSGANEVVISNGLVTFNRTVNFSTQTASSILGTDASKNITTLTALPNGTTATTQAAGDNSNKISTDAFVTTAINNIFGKVNTWTVSQVFNGASVFNGGIGATNSFGYQFNDNSSSNYGTLNVGALSSNVFWYMPPYGGSVALREDFPSGSYSTSATSQTTFTVSIGSTQANTTYKINVTPTSLSAPYYVTNKTTNTFDVVFTSAITGAVSFDWSLFK